MIENEYSPLRKFVAGFVNVTDEEWRLHEAVLRRRNLKKGEWIIKQGQICEYVSFINYGCFRIYNIVKEEEVTTDFRFEGHYITDYRSFLTQQPSTEYIIALEDAEVIELHYNDMQTLYEKVPSWQKYGRLIAEFLYIKVTERAQSLLFDSPEELYTRLMKERPKVIENMPQRYIASYLGIQPESLSRIRKRMMTQDGRDV
ncbi:MAG TPA: Crp/Fnr family transcriptional regulator [Chryseolinea sp.]|nr:Crp/Fnr family transcriptional regulator [Chryseolinea sp.]HPM32540.1 Crp/Fnr family transcriptional regulator [Chryseolinea sp.]